MSVVYNVHACTCARAHTLPGQKAILRNQECTGLWHAHLVKKLNSCDNFKKD